MKNLETLKAELVAQKAKTDELNAQLMDAIFNGSKGTATLEKKAAASAKLEEAIKAEIAKAEAELAGVIFRATKALKAADAAEDAALGAFFAGLSGKAQGPKAHKRDFARERAERRAMDPDRYADACIKAQAKEDAREAKKAALAAKKAAEEEAVQTAAEAKAAKVTAGDPTTREIAIRDILQRKDLLVSLIGTCDDRMDDLENAIPLIGARRIMEARKLEAVAKVYERYGFDTAPLADRYAETKRHFDAVLSNIEYEKREAKAQKLRCKRELKVLKAALKYIALNNAVDEAYVVNLCSACRTAKPHKDDDTVRIAAKIPAKEKTPNIAVRNVSSDAFYRDFKVLKNGMAFKPDYAVYAISDAAKGRKLVRGKLSGTFGYRSGLIAKAEKQLTPASRKLLKSAREARANLESVCEKTQKMSFSVRKQDCTIVHLPVSLLLTCLGVDPEKLEVTEELFTVDHGTEEFFRTDWLVWGDTQEEADKAYAEFCEKLYDRLDQRGFVYNREKLYRTSHAGASQLKAEKVVCMEVHARKSIEDMLYFGKTETEFAAEQKIVGPDLLKAWANMNRPWCCDLEYEDGTKARPADLLITNSPEYVYYHNKAIKIGGLYNGKTYAIGPCDNPVKLFQGQIGFWKKLKGAGGQLNGWGLKGFAFYLGGSVLDKFLADNHMTREQFFDCKIRDIDGRLVRIGDYAGIATDDVWKFDKFFRSWSEYLAKVEALSKKYSIIGRLGILRQSEDAEGQSKRRHATRSLLQQYFHWTEQEVSRLVAPTANKIKALMEFKNALRSLANFGGDERTALQKLFAVAPWLWMAPGVQKYWRNKLREMVREMMANKLDAKGQYPYIIQDPDAMLEILILGKKPEETGILKAGQISVADVPDGTKLLALRFPANFLTVRVQTNVSMKDIFADLGNVCVLSIHDDILIVQDGDTDGDEICILYNELLIELVERMLSYVNPPVVVFEHGSKAKAEVPGTPEELRRKLAHARFMASHNDQTGIYADLARDCAYLAAKAKAEGRESDFRMCLIWMAAASTGAIISIDQVKGNDISKVLIDWLAEISKKVRKQMGYKKPYTQHFLKGVSLEECNAPWTSVLPDAVAVEGKKQVGDYKVVSPIRWNAEAAKKACFVPTEKVPHCQVQKHPVSQAMKDFFGRTLYNDQTVITPDGEERIVDEDFRNAVENGLPVGMKEILVFLYHNEQALINKAEGALMQQKRQEFYSQCWKALIDFGMTDMEPSRTVNKTAAVKKCSVYTTLVNEALELVRNNGMNDEKGGYTMFCLNVAAAAMEQTIRSNGWNLSDFAEEKLFTSDLEGLEDEEVDAALDGLLAEQDSMFGPDELEFHGEELEFSESDMDLSMLDDSPEFSESDMDLSVLDDSMEL